MPENPKHIRKMPITEISINGRIIKSTHPRYRRVVARYKLEGKPPGKYGDVEIRDITLSEAKSRLVADAEEHFLAGRTILDILASVIGGIPPELVADIQALQAQKAAIAAAETIKQLEKLQD